MSGLVATQQAYTQPGGIPSASARPRQPPAPPSRQAGSFAGRRPHLELLSTAGSSASRYLMKYRCPLSFTRSSWQEGSSARILHLGGGVGWERGERGERGGGSSA